MNVLVIPDVHIEGVADAEVPKRIRWLADVINRVRPQHTICLGDWLDLPEMSNHETKEQRSASVERLYKSLAASRASMRYLRDTCGTALGHGHFVWGNHETRLSRFYAENPFASPAENPLEWLAREAGISDTFPDVAHGVSMLIGDNQWNFRHFYPMKGSGRAVGGKTVAQRLLSVYPGINMCVGHSHVFSVATATLGTGAVHTAISAGCLLDRLPHYLQGVYPDWWCGVVVLSSDGTVSGVPYAHLSLDPPR